MAFVTPVVDHWLEREIAQWVHPMNNRSDHPSHHERYGQNSLSNDDNNKIVVSINVLNTLF